MKQNRLKAAVSSSSVSIQNDDDRSTDVLLFGEQQLGYVDSYGYNVSLGGWFLIGWTARPFKMDPPATIEVHIEDQRRRVVAESSLIFFERTDLEHTRVGVLLFVPGSSRLFGVLRQFSFTLDEVTYAAKTGLVTPRRESGDILEMARTILLGQALGTENRDQLLALCMRPCFVGHETLNTLSEAILLEVDQAIPCPPHGLVLKGWLLAPMGSIRRLTLRSGGRSGTIDIAKALRIARPDVISAVGAERGYSETHSGFAAYVPDAWSPGDVTYLEIELESGEIAFKPIRISHNSGLSAIREVLDGLKIPDGALDGAFDHTLGPAVATLNAARLAAPASFEMLRFGDSVETPIVSVVVPLYGRIDFFEYQMALFSRDPEYARSDLIYVLDDPTKREALLSLANSVYERFRIPFRLLLMRENRGFAPANNVGLSVARAPYVCFMNSDVFPLSGGLLAGLSARLSQDAGIGVIGPRLLFEDGSIQHEGCYFRPLKEFGHWHFIDHHHKGRRPSPASGLKAFEVITGACMLMRRELAVELGGFDERYIVGDFEDSDLCLKLRAKRLRAVVDTELSAYHLERKSQVAPSQSWRMNLTLYNAWVHERRWFMSPTKTTPV
jgi:GT2 family glycosyltransferase